MILKSNTSKALMISLTVALGKSNDFTCYIAFPPLL